VTKNVMNVAFTHIYIFSGILKINSNGEKVLCFVLFHCTLQFSGM